ncbi:hypothetical protein KUTeg_022330 [Tegillarca granosa]|uniref:Alpha-tubulin N-acetyltransferase n=1 Tax=Tegillarca granosa TaxID=220873 RepID=A0ABQ9E8R1_TEGGR|nr:hypothetical protein KUTeg_022330 [Tegillarca granosa]
MEFSFNINNLLGNTITKLDKGVDPYRRNAEGLSYIVLRSQLFQVIDEMGAASAKAQGLRTIITTGRKLELSDHILYIMKDAEANKGKGAVVGLLKIGYKKLFVYDSLGGNHELVPMCVLDFYVHESRQRMGCGKMLFECMLKPSFKFSKFLAKHYGLKDEIQQVNNFVVFDGFFQGHKSMDFNDNNLPRHGQASAPVHYGRQVNGRPWSVTM